MLNHSLVKMFFGIVASMLVIAFLLAAFKLMRADFSALQYGRIPGGTKVADVDLGKWETSVQNLKRIHLIDPENISVIKSLANLYQLRGVIESDPDVLGNVFFDEALKYNKLGLVNSPNDPYLWANVTKILAYTNSDSEEFTKAYEKAYLLAGHDKYLRKSLNIPDIPDVE